MNSKRVLFFNEHIGGHQYRLRIRNAKGDSREWWKYDAKRRVIHIANNKRHVISNERNKGLEKGKKIVMSYFKNSVQSIVYDRRSQRLHSGRDKRMCVDVWGGRDAENNVITYWTCHNGKNQKWSIAYKPGNPTNTGFKNNKRIRIRSKMTGGRVVTVMNHIGKNQYRTVIQTPVKNNNKQVWYLDSSKGSLRSAWHGSYFLSIEFGNNQRGRRVVARRWAKGSDNTQRFMFRNRRLGSIMSYQNKRLCIDVKGGRNQRNGEVIIWSCHKGRNQ